MEGERKEGGERAKGATTEPPSSPLLPPPSPFPMYTRAVHGPGTQFREMLSAEF